MSVVHQFTRGFVLFGLFLLSGCATKPQQDTLPVQSQEQRIDQLNQLNHWQIKGKIAFISPEERVSATLIWKKSPSEQELKLNNFLGVNILTLNSNNGQHTLITDGNEYHSDDLSSLLRQATGLTLPVNALQYWLKGIAYTKYDQLSYDTKDQLPLSLIAHTNQGQWQVGYRDFRQIDQYTLPHKLTIKQNQLTIKININQWKL